MTARIRPLGSQRQTEAGFDFSFSFGRPTTYSSHGGDSSAGSHASENEGLVRTQGAVTGFRERISDVFFTCSFEQISSSQYKVKIDSGNIQELKGKEIDVSGKDFHEMKNNAVKKISKLCDGIMNARPIWTSPEQLPLEKLLKNEHVRPGTAADIPPQTAAAPQPEQEATTKSANATTKAAEVCFNDLHLTSTASQEAKQSKPPKDEKPSKTLGKKGKTVPPFIAKVFKKPIKTLRYIANKINLATKPFFKRAKEGQVRIQALNKIRNEHLKQAKHAQQRADRSQAHPKTQRIWERLQIRDSLKVWLIRKEISKQDKSNQRNRVAGATISNAATSSNHRAKKLGSGFCENLGASIATIFRNRGRHRRIGDTVADLTVKPLASTATSMGKKAVYDGVAAGVKVVAPKVAKLVPSADAAFTLWDLKSALRKDGPWGIAVEGGGLAAATAGAEAAMYAGMTGAIGPAFVGGVAAIEAKRLLSQLHQAINASPKRSELVDRIISCKTEQELNDLVLSSTLELNLSQKEIELFSQRLSDKKANEPSKASKKPPAEKKRSKKSTNIPLPPNPNVNSVAAAAPRNAGNPQRGGNNPHLGGGGPNPPPGGRPPGGGPNPPPNHPPNPPPRADGGPPPAGGRQPPPAPPNPPPPPSSTTPRNNSWAKTAGQNYKRAVDGAISGTTQSLKEQGKNLSNNVQGSVGGALAGVVTNISKYKDDPLGLARDLTYEPAKSTVVSVSTRALYDGGAEGLKAFAPKRLSDIAKKFGLSVPGFDKVSACWDLFRATQKEGAKGFVRESGGLLGSIGGSAIASKIGMGALGCGFVAGIGAFGVKWIFEALYYEDYVKPEQRYFHYRWNDFYKRIGKVDEDDVERLRKTIASSGDSDTQQDLHNALNCFLCEDGLHQLSLMYQRTHFLDLNVIDELEKNLKAISSCTTAAPSGYSCVPICYYGNQTVRPLANIKLLREGFTGYISHLTNAWAKFKAIMQHDAIRPVFEQSNLAAAVQNIERGLFARMTVEVRGEQFKLIQEIVVELKNLFKDVVDPKHFESSISDIEAFEKAIAHLMRRCLPHLRPMIKQNNVCVAQPKVQPIPTEAPAALPATKPTPVILPTIQKEDLKLPTVQKTDREVVFDIKSPLHRAVRSRNDQLCALLIEAGFDKDAQDEKGYTPLHHAVGIEDLVLCQELLRAGCNRNIRDHLGFTPLHYAVATENIELCRFLLKAGCRRDVPDSVGRTPLHQAVILRNKQLCELLLEFGAGWHARSHSDGTVLHLAQSCEVPDIVELFMTWEKQTASVPERNDDKGRTILHRVVQSENEVLCAMLLEAGFDRDAQDGEGYTALHYAAGKESIKLCTQLLESGCGRDIQDKKGYTPLHYLVEARNVEGCKLLLKYGCRRDVPDNMGHSSQYYARNSGDRRLYELFTVAANE